VEEGSIVKDTLWQRLARGVSRVRQRSDWGFFAGPNWLGRIMTTQVTDRFHAKQGRSTGRWIIRADGRELAVYLKRHFRLPWWRGLLAAFWPDAGWSPALQEWRHLEWARTQGMPVPSAVAAAEFIGPWGKLQSVLALEELTAMVPINEALPVAAANFEPATFRRWKCGLTAEIARLTRALHDRRCFHKDLYLCHFYILLADTASLPAWRGRVHLIDLHRLGRHRLTWPFWQVKDLAQLLYSSETVGVDACDRLRFWREYLGTGRRTFVGRWLRRLIVAKWGRYRKHNLRRKANGHSPLL
jgi:heptose I phosphotransferase